MYRALRRSALPVFLGLLAVFAPPVSAQQAPLDCSVGPLSKTYGSTPWLVYACSDEKSVVVMSAPGSPAAPFYFILFQKEGRYVVGGEGTGPKNVTDRAYAELVRLSEAEIAGLITAARQRGPGGSHP